MRNSDRACEILILRYGLCEILIDIIEKIRKLRVRDLVRCDVMSAEENENLASDLAALGYPGFSYLKLRRKTNPAQVLFSALSVKNLDARLTEALPWVLLEYPDLDWQWLVQEAELNGLQNKLGFLSSVARRLAEKSGREDTANRLREQEATLERSRLVREETLCHDSLTQVERRWLRSNRSKEAEYWGLLTDLSPEHLSYVP
jgi:hypothetical protein